MEKIDKRRKISDEDVIEIIKLNNAGMINSEIAKKLNISNSTVSLIINKKRHISFLEKENIEVTRDPFSERTHRSSDIVNVIDKIILNSCCDSQDDHLLWKDETLQRTPRIYYKDKLVPVKNVIYEFYYRAKVSKEQSIFSTCNNIRCVDVRHFVLVDNTSNSKKYKTKVTKKKKEKKTAKEIKNSLLFKELKNKLVDGGV